MARIFVYTVKVLRHDTCITPMFSLVFRLTTCIVECSYIQLARTLDFFSLDISKCSDPPTNPEMFWIVPYGHKKIISLDQSFQRHIFNFLTFRTRCLLGILLNELDDLQKYWRVRLSVICCLTIITNWLRYLSRPFERVV